MSIKTLNIESYRSIQKLSIELGQINIITGANGCGKSNVYKAIHLLAQAAKGTFAQTLAVEGGIPSVMWAGKKRYHDDNLRLKLGFTSDTFNYQLCCGVPEPVPGTMFILDPEVKEEYIWFGLGRRQSNTYLERLGNSAFVYSDPQEKSIYPLSISSAESIISQLKEPHLYPELYALANTIKQWRFYHNFRTDVESPIRSAQIGVRTPILSNDGHDLAAALRTIIEIGDENKLYQLINQAFPGARLLINDPYGKSRFELKLKMPDILRPLEAYELSDGTLRYLCLLAALLSPRLPTMLVLNEPEMSLHPDLLTPLAELIIHASESSQIIVTTHSEILVNTIKQYSGVAPINLIMTKQGTQIL